MSKSSDKLEALFQAAVALETEAQRAEYLSRACPDPALRREVESLLACHQNPDSIFAAKMSRMEPTASEGAGTLIGRYKLLEQIGEGGFGVVWMAEQEEPVRRRVALKIIKLGMDTKQVVARFEAERQALAMMDHPNIATVFDGGATDTGRPYFVMELVKGVPITKFCDERNLSTGARLELFLQVCQAVQHAHQKGIIHRDLKPSNILVTEKDDRPVAKVIDFGIAKATQARLTEKTLFTRLQQWVGTPAYMSPEQAGLASLDVDTRSDVYSLGVLLYELLTGKPPFDVKTLLAAGLDEMRRTIREQEPVRPSMRLQTMLEGERTATAQHRRTDGPKLIHLVRADLDWIVMKCLEKDRARRYETANGLAADIECYLSHRPVSAAAPTVRYRTMKYVRRHRRVLATAAAFALLLVLGTTLIVWQARRAGQADTERTNLRQAKWALETALPEVERLLDKDDYTGAFKLLEQARASIGQNPRFQALAARTVSVISFETTPPGAEVFIREYNHLNPNWEPAGKSPLKGIRLPQGAKRWKVSLNGYEIAEGALFTGPEPVELKVQLEKAGAIAPGMVRIHGEDCSAHFCTLDWGSLPELELSDFLMDRYEVTNRRFKEFVEAGGYQKPEYWKHKFLKGGVELSWPEAMKLLVDQSGRPGPATWVDGEFPKGHEEFPVGGVSWYEAAAYAEWAGKRLPTVYHWSLAAGKNWMVDPGFVAPLSNFRGSGPAQVGTYQGMTCSGIYDMAGNVREWCFNEALDGCRVNAGGGWNEAPCTFGGAEKCPAFSRKTNLGFRCMKLLTDDPVWKQAAGSVAFSPPFVIGKQTPCPDELFKAYRRLYDYNKTELQPTNEAAEDISSYTHWERVSFNAAFGNQRVRAHVFLPRGAKPPFQTIVHFFQTDALDFRSVLDSVPQNTIDLIAKSHRAFVTPVFRGNWPKGALPIEDAIGLVKDFRRTLDYLETRPDVFDTNKLAYSGASWGGIWGGIVPAIDLRVRAAVLGAGGFYPYPQEYSQVNFAPRIQIPILLQGGRYDTYFPLESNQEPYLALFATAENDKHHTIYETGHYIWSGSRWMKDLINFLDKYLGPTSGGIHESADARRIDGENRKP